MIKSLEQSLTSQASTMLTPNSDIGNDFRVAGAILHEYCGYFQQASGDISTGISDTQVFPNQEFLLCIFRNRHECIEKEKVFMECGNQLSDSIMKSCFAQYQQYFKCKAQKPREIDPAE